MGLFDSFNYDPLGYTGLPNTDVGESEGLLGGIKTWMRDPRNQAGLAAWGAALAKAGAPSRVPLGAFAGGLNDAFTAFGQAGQKFDLEQMQKQMQELQLKKMEAEVNRKASPLDMFNKIDAEKFTPESIQKFLATQNPADLAPRVKKEITPAGIPIDPYNVDMTKNYGKVDNVNLGGNMAFMNPMGQLLGALPITQSADNKASTQTTMRGQNMADERARDLNAITLANASQKIENTPNGPLLVNTRTGAAKPVTIGGNPVQGDSAMKRESSAKRVLGILDQAEKLIPQATGSAVGTAVDYGLGALGRATSGATATAQLSTLEGQLIADMPRMEGPQSDKDVALYRQAAGDISNPMKPRAVRLAAVKQIRELQSRYATPQAGSGWSITPVD